MKARYEIRYRSGIKQNDVFETYADIGHAKDCLDTFDDPIGKLYGYDTMTKEVFFSFRYCTKYKLFAGA